MTDKETKDLVEKVKAMNPKDLSAIIDVTIKEEELKKAKRKAKELSPKVKASMKYDKANVKQVKLSLNKKTDADILRILESKDNVQGYIKELIRSDNAKKSK